MLSISYSFSYGWKENYISNVWTWVGNKYWRVHEVLQEYLDNVIKESLESYRSTLSGVHELKNTWTPLGVSWETVTEYLKFSMSTLRRVQALKSSMSTLIIDHTMKGTWRSTAYLVYTVCPLKSTWSPLWVPWEECLHWIVPRVLHKYLERNMYTEEYLESPRNTLRSFIHWIVHGVLQKYLEKN